PYWRLPYKELSLPSDLLGYGLVAVAALAFTACIAGGVRLLPAVVVIGASVPCAVMARVIPDGLADPTSHNLWPIEVVIAAVLGFSASLAGAVPGSLLAWIGRVVTARRGGA
ncbi:MAG TPA: hypothetical protein VF188_11805, partial [Longimicrobiales bacterium]